MIRFIFVLPFIFNLHGKVASEEVSAEVSTEVEETTTIAANTTITTIPPMTTVVVTPTTCHPINPNTSCEDIAKYFKFSCEEEGQEHSGVYEIWQNNRYEKVYCRFGVHGIKSMTMIQRRGRYKLPHDNFYLNWANYSEGFGDFENEFWLGLEKIRQLAEESPLDLIITLKSFRNEAKPAIIKLLNFKLGTEEEGYPLHYSKIQNIPTGNTIKSYFPEDGSRFYTYDNDTSYSTVTNYKGAFWYTSGSNGHYQNVNGYNYDNARYDAEGMYWYYYYIPNQGYNYYTNLKEVTMNLAPHSNFIIEGNIQNLKSCQGINQIAIGGELSHIEKTCSCEKILCFQHECHNWGFINKTLSLINGGLHLHGYNFNIDSPKDVFIATGVNLGVHKFDGMTNEALHTKLKPYLGHENSKDPRSLELSIEEALEVDSFIKQKAVWYAEEYGFHLSKRGEAVLIALYYWCGNFDEDCTCNFYCNKEKGILKNALKSKRATDEDLVEALNRLLYCSICDGLSCDKNSKTKQLVKLIKVITNPLYRHHHNINVKIQ